MRNRATATLRVSPRRETALYSTACPVARAKCFSTLQPVRPPQTAEMAPQGRGEARRGTFPFMRDGSSRTQPRPHHSHLDSTRNPGTRKALASCGALVFRRFFSGGAANPHSASHFELPAPRMQCRACSACTPCTTRQRSRHRVVGPTCWSAKPQHAPRQPHTPSYASARGIHRTLPADPSQHSPRCWVASPPNVPSPNHLPHKGASVSLRALGGVSAPPGTGTIQIAGRAATAATCRASRRSGAPARPHALRALRTPAPPSNDSPGLRTQATHHPSAVQCALDKRRRRLLAPNDHCPGPHPHARSDVHVCPTHHAHAGPQPGRAVRAHGGYHGGVCVLGGQQGEWHQVGGADAVRLPRQPQEVHPW